MRMHSFVRVINKDNYGEFITENPNIHKVIFFTSRKSTSPLAKALSKHFKGKLSFGEMQIREMKVMVRKKTLVGRSRVRIFSCLVAFQARAPRQLSACHETLGLHF